MTRVKEALERAVEIFENTLGQDHPELATAQIKLAQYLANKGKREAALQLARRGRDIRLASLGPEHGHTAIAERVVAEIEGGLEGG